MADLEFFALSEKGLRERNEDACLARKAGGIYLFAVAEGMGGPGEGPSAAEIAVSALLEEGSPKGGTLVEALESCLARADDALYRAQNVETGNGFPAVAMTLAMVGAGGECVVSSPGQRKVFFLPLAPAGEEGQGLAADHVPPELLDPGAGMHEAVLPAGFLLLCSDGISDFIGDTRIGEILIERGDDLEDACRKLIYEAFQNGSSDNLAVVLARKAGG